MGLTVSLPLIVTVLVSWLWYVEIVVTTFLSLYFATETGPEYCAIISPFFSFVSFTFFENIFLVQFQFQCADIVLSCVQSSVFWLDRVSYRNYQSTQSNPVSVEQGFPTFFWMATHLTKLPRFRDTPLMVRPPTPPSTRLEKKIHNYIIKTNEANLTARFCYLIISKAEFRLMTSDFKT
jgi:hypothetical protein